MTPRGASAIATDGEAIYWANVDPVELHRIDSSGDVVLASMGSDSSPIIAISVSAAGTYFSAANALWYLDASGPQVIDPHGASSRLVGGNASVFALGTSTVTEYSAKGIVNVLGGLANAVAVSVDGTTVFVADSNGLEAFAGGATTPTHTEAIPEIVDIAALDGTVFILSTTASNTYELTKYEEASGTVSIVAENLAAPLHPRLGVSERYAYVSGPSHGDDLFMPITSVAHIGLTNAQTNHITASENGTIPGLVVMDGAVYWIEQAAQTTFTGHALYKSCE
jgi:hypothetical protein